MGTKPFKPSFIVPMSHFNHEQSIFLYFLASLMIVSAACFTKNQDLLPGSYG